MTLATESTVVNPDAQTPTITTIAVTARDARTGTDTTVNLMAEPAGVDGLVITPHLVNQQLSGGWSITHVTSGLALPVDSWRGVDLPTARRVATELATLPIDWTVDGAELAVQIRDHRPAFFAAVRRGRWPIRAESTGLPLDGETTISADTLITRIVADAALRHAATVHYAKRRDDPADSDGPVLDAANTAALLHAHGLAAALIALGQYDAGAADAVAQRIWEAWCDGQGVGTDVREWCDEAGVEPVDPDSNPARFGTPPAHVRAMWTDVHKLELPDSGVTLTQLRQAIARYGTLADQVWARPGADTNESTVERLAHGCSYHSWALTALLGWLADRHPEITSHAAALVDRIGCNGGDTRYCTEVAPLIGGTAEGAITFLAGVVGEVTRHSDADGRASATVTVHNLVDKADVRVPADAYASFGHLLAAGQRVEIVATVTRDADTPVRAESITAG